MTRTPVLRTLCLTSLRAEENDDGDGVERRPRTRSRTSARRWTGPATVEGYTVNFVSIRQAMDLGADARVLAGRELLLPALGLHAHRADDRELRRPR